MLKFALNWQTPKCMVTMSIFCVHGGNSVERARLMNEALSTGGIDFLYDN